MEYIPDSRQESKVRHKLKDIVVIVLFATLGNADDWAGAFICLARQGNNAD